MVRSPDVHNHIGSLYWFLTDEFMHAGYDPLPNTAGTPEAEANSDPFGY